MAVSGRVYGLRTYPGVSERWQWSWPLSLAFLGACCSFVLLQAQASPPAVDDGVAAAALDAASLAAQPPPQEDEPITPADMLYLRWLWWPWILYLFWGMGYICDVYFVRTIEVISERFDIPDDVAGATLMALGCNGPELSLNTISLFHASNIGVGAVIGGEVFNVLVIIGTAVLATPEIYIPVKLGAFSFLRDVLFYIVSVGLLYWALKDGEVTRLNAGVLLGGAVVYAATVVFSPSLRGLFSGLGKRTARWYKSCVKRRVKRIMRNASQATLRKIASVESLTQGLVEKGDSGLQESWDTSETVDDVNLLDAQEAEKKSKAPDPKLVAMWETAEQCSDPSEGSVLGVRVDVRNRLMDKSHRIEKRFIWLRQGALMVSTGVDPKHASKRTGHSPSGIMYDYAKHDQQQNHWHHGGLVNQPVYKNLLEVSQSIEDFSSGLARTGSRPMLNDTPTRETRERIRSGDMQAVFPTAFRDLGLGDTAWEIIPLEDVLYVERVLEPKEGNFEYVFTLHVHQHDNHLGHLLTLNFYTKEEEVLHCWVQSLQSNLHELRRRTIEPESVTCRDLLMEWVQWVKFPVMFFLKVSIPDMDNKRMERFYPVAFVMSMAWLAVFAYSVIAACDGIHRDFGISTAVLGFTVAAAGTSLPNVFSGMVVARQGKTTMAIANALGANVQNVFLALAIPWTIQANLSPTGSFPLEVTSLSPAVIECAITLIPVVMVFFCCDRSLPKWSGGLFLFTYAVYLVFALGQEITHCSVWPLSCHGRARDPVSGFQFMGRG